MSLGCPRFSAAAQKWGHVGASHWPFSLPQHYTSRSMVTQRTSILCCSLVIHWAPFGKWQERLRNYLFKPGYWKGDREALCPCSFQWNCLFSSMRRCLLVSWIHRSCTGSSSLLQKSPWCRAGPGLLLPVHPKAFLGTATTAAEFLDFVNLFRQERPLILHSHRAEWDLWI